MVSAAVGIWASSKSAAPVAAEQYQAQDIRRAVFADGRLWMMSDEGSLLSLRSTDSRPERVRTEGKVIEICKSQGHLLALIQAGSGHWSVQRRGSDGWDTGLRIASDNETLTALGCTDDGSAVTIVTNRRLLEVENAAVRAVKLSQELESPFAIAAALITGDTIWVGLNIGEWGGGLRRIRRSDGMVEVVESNRSKELCGGPLNTGCDPVNGIVASPSNPSCAIAAIGLVHFMSHGRIVEVCDGSVRRLYFKALDPQPPYGTRDEGEPSSTIAFFGLSRAGNRIWAIGTDGLYRFEGSLPPQFRPLPKFENRGGYRVSFEVPGLVLLMTDVNQSHSLSGTVPIMAAR